MPRRIALGSLVAGVLALLATGVHALQLHATQWWGYRNELAMFTTMQARVEELQLELTDPAMSPTPPEGPWTSFLSTLPTGLTVLAVTLLSIALVWAGYRWWGVVVPLVLNALAAAGWEPLLSVRVIPGGAPEASAGWAATPSNPWDAWITPAASYPWTDGLLLGLLMTIPALVALGSLRAGAAATSGRATTGIPTRVALTWSGAVAGLCAAWVLIQDLASSPFGPDWSLILDRTGTVAVVIVSTGLLAATLPRAWAVRAGIAAVTLVLLNAVVKSTAVAYWGSEWFDPAAIAGQLGTLALGPAAVLLGPGLGRWWVATFRRTAADAPVAPEPLAP